MGCTRVCPVSTYFFYYEHILWVHVRTASARRFYRVPTIYVLSKKIKVSSFTSYENLFNTRVHVQGRVFVDLCTDEKNDWGPVIRFLQHSSNFFTDRSEMVLYVIFLFSLLVCCILLRSIMLFSTRTYW